MAENNPSIASSVALCLETFETFAKTLTCSPPEKGYGSFQSAAADCIGRFRVWSGNIGAHQRGKSSLDHRLRDASYIRIRVLRLLDNLNKLLIEALSITQGSQNPLEEFVEFGSDSSDSDEDENGRPSEMEQIFLHLTELITSLYRLSMTIRTSTQKNRYIKSAAIDLSHYVRFDIEHTRHKFPLAQEFIVERLGKAISRRRQFIRYSGKHAAKLAVTIDKKKTESTTTATDLCGNEVVIPKKATFVDDMQSATSYATSFGSPGRVRMPSMPSEAADERPFECPICHTIEIVSDTYGWMKHVYRDLQPYVCTYRDCGSADETFESRHQWIKHENQEHRRIWTCSGHCNATFQSSTQLVAHIKKHSPVAIADAQIPALIAMRASPIARDTMHTCPLCSVKGLQEKALQRHLDHHHEELALFALPNDLAESENDTDSSVSSIQRRAEYFTFGREVKASHISAAVDDRSHTSCSASSQHQGQSDSRQTSLTKGLNKKAKEEEVIKLAIAEYKENEEKKETANEKTDRAYKERVKEVITEAGRSEDYVESDPIKEKTFKMKGPSRPTSIKAHRKHLSPETLDLYDLPWQWDDRDPNYIIIKRWIPEHEQDELFEHSRKLRDGPPSKLMRTFGK